MFLFLWIATAAATPKQVIRFESPNRSFELELMEDRLVLRNGKESQVIKKTTCNNVEISNFWSSTVSQVKALPKIKDGSYKPWIQFENQHYLLPLSLGGAHKAVRQIDAKFMTFKTKEERLCGQKRS